MNALTDPVILGVDVSKEWLDIHRQGDAKVTRIDNTRIAIDAYLKPYRGAAMAVEATNRFHELMVERARRWGVTVYLISGYELKHYAVSVRRRMRTDPIDAQLLSRFLARERDQLTPYQPRPAQLNRLWQLLKRKRPVPTVSS
jgi:transposase